jgi:hypothetical protein
MLLAALISVAFAESIPIRDCGLYVHGTRPVDGQTGVPTDARLVAALSDHCMGGAATYLLELLDADGVVIQSERQSITVPHKSGLLVLTPEGGLQPNTDYTLRISDEGGWPEAESTFRTGEGLVVGIGDASPRVVLTGASATEGLDEWVVFWSANLEIAPDPDALSFVGLLGEGEEEGVDGFAGVGAPDDDGDLTLYGSLTMPERPKELCLEGAQIDGLGVLSAPVESCVNVNRGSCASAAAPSSALLTLLGLLTLRRRRVT